LLLLLPLLLLLLYLSLVVYDDATARDKTTGSGHVTNISSRVEVDARER